VRFELTALRTRVARRILGLFILCAFVPIGTLAILSYRRVATELTEQSRLRLRQASKTIGMAVLKRLDDLDQELVAIVERLNAGTSGRPAPGTSFKSLSLVRPGVAPLPLLDQPPDTPPLPPGGDAHLQTGEPLLLAGDPSRLLLARMLDPRAPERGLVWAELDPRTVWRATDVEETVPPGADLCLFQQAQVPLYCPRRPPTAFLESLGRTSTTTDEVPFRWRGDGDASLAGHWSLFLEGQYGTPSLTVVVSEAEASVLAPMADFRRTFPLAVLLTLWFVLLLGYVLIRKSTEPLAQLQEGTRRLAALDFSSPVHITSGDEFEDLATSFNTMADQLRQQLSESARLNAALRQASESLRENEARLRTILETAAVAVLTTNDTGVVESFNRTAEAVFGYARDEVVGRPASMLLADTAVTRAPGGPFAVPGPARELLGRRKDGKTFPMELDVSEAEVAGRALRTGFARDVSERRRAEEERARLEAQLRQAQKLETIGTLAGGIAHDFNNILTAVIGYLDLALPEVPSESRALADLREVRRAADRAKDLVRQILLFSRQGEQERRSVNLASLIKETLKLIRATLPTTIEIRETVDRTTAPVLADPTQLHQVLMNLCTNAAHAMRQTGVLDVGLGTVTVDAGMAEAPPTLAPGRYAQLRVRDTGHGMDPTTLDRLFEPFFTTKPPGEGTGLGLSVVHGIVTNHGGAIDVESAPGAGTTFTIYLPVAASAPEAALVSDATDLTGHEHLLVVDDDPAIAEVTKRLLERQGYRVTARTSSPEALELLRADAGQYDAMLTDQTMPGLTGLQLAEAALQLRPDLPIILTSGVADAPLADQGRALGVREFLVKPVNTRDLGEAIRRVLRRVAEQRQC